MSVSEVDVISRSCLDVLDDGLDIIISQMADIEPIPIPKTRNSLGLSPVVLLVAELPKLLLFAARCSELLDEHPDIEVFVSHPSAFHHQLFFGERIKV